MTRRHTLPKVPRTPGRSPLARYVDSVYDHRHNNFSDMAKRVTQGGGYATPETFRKALYDGYKVPLRPDTVRQLAVGLGVPEARIRDLDNANPRWGATAAEPLPSLLVTETDVLDWLREHLNGFADPVIALYEQMRMLLEQQEPPRRPRKRRIRSGAETDAALSSAAPSRTSG